EVGEREKVAIRSRRPGYDAYRAEVGSGNPIEGPGTLPMSIPPELTAHVVEHVDDQIVSRRGDAVDGLARSRLHHQLQVALAGEKGIERHPDQSPRRPRLDAHRPRIPHVDDDLLAHAH